MDRRNGHAFVRVHGAASATRVCWKRVNVPSTDGYGRPLVRYPRHGSRQPPCPPRPSPHAAGRVGRAAGGRSVCAVARASRITRPEGAAWPLSDAPGDCSLASEARPPDPPSGCRAPPFLYPDIAWRRSDHPRWPVAPVWRRSDAGRARYQRWARPQRSAHYRPGPRSPPTRAPPQAVPAVPR